MEQLSWQFRSKMKDKEMTEHEILEELNTEEVERLTPMIAYLLLILLTGIPGNGLVCYIYRSRYSMSSSRWFIFFLAAVDLLLCVLIIPAEIATSFMQYNFTNVYLCKITVFFNLMSLLSLGLTLVIVSIDRYRKVCKPLGWQINFNKARLLSAAAVVLGFIISLPVWPVYGIYNFKFEGFNVTASECSFRESLEDSNLAFFYVLFGFAIFTGALVTICILYCFIGVEIKQHIQRENIKRHVSLSASMARRHNHIVPTVAGDIDIKLKRVKFADVADVNTKNNVKFSEPVKDTNALANSSELTDETSSTTNVSDDDDTCDFEVPVIPSKNLQKTKSRRLRRAKARKATFSMFLISIAFVLSYLPFLCLLLARSVDTGFDESLSNGGRAVYKFFLRSYFLNCAINPFIYGISDSRFRQSCKDVLYSIHERLLTCFSCCKSKRSCLKKKKESKV